MSNTTQQEQQQQPEHSHHLRTLLKSFAVQMVVLGVVGILVYYQYPDVFNVEDNKPVDPVAARQQEHPPPPSTLTSVWKDLGIFAKIAVSMLVLSIVVVVLLTLGITVYEVIKAPLSRAEKIEKFVRGTDGPNTDRSVVSLQMSDIIRKQESLWSTFMRDFRAAKHEWTTNNNIVTESIEDKFKNMARIGQEIIEEFDTVKEDFKKLPTTASDTEKAIAKRKFMLYSSLASEYWAKVKYIKQAGIDFLFPLPSFLHEDSTDINRGLGTHW